MLRLATWALLISVVQTAAAEPETTKPQLVRPVLWWSDINRTSDGGGGGIKATTSCIRAATSAALGSPQVPSRGERPVTVA